MPARVQEPPMTEAVISVSEMARRLNLSRCRFYELVRAGVFPAPCYCPYSRRALYPAELRDKCLNVKATNIGVNGQYALFNRPRSAAVADINRPASQRTAGHRPRRQGDPLLASLREGLLALGHAAVSDDQIRSALQSAYPSGAAGVDPGTVLASVFRLIRASNLSPSRQNAV